tara:strand:- start:300 stop:1004 length:705 start_codon:yes stop_codon:yes gene_type:complete
MRKIIFIILLFYSSISLAEKIDGLFGLKIGEILTKDMLIEEQKNRKISFNHEDVIQEVLLQYKNDFDSWVMDEHERTIKSIYIIKEKLLKTNDGITYSVIPKTSNSMFEYYTVDISLLSNKILVIRGLGDMHEAQCIETRKLLFNHFIDKHSSFYLPYWIEKNDENDEEILFFAVSSEQGHQIRISCYAEAIMAEFEDLEYSSKIFYEEKSEIIRMLDLELEKIANDDLDVSGM